MKYIVSIICFLSIGLSFGQNTDTTYTSSDEQQYRVSDEFIYVYQKPKFFNFITGIPRNYLNLGKESVKKENFKWLGLTVTSTALLLATDERTLDAAENLQTLGLGENHYYGSLGGIAYPKSTSSALYYLGHGNTSLLVGVGLLIKGGVSKDYRALHTSSEIVEGILTLGVLTQGLKRVFGRESPYVRTKPIGNFDFFPNLKEYAKNTPHYDALPSGHVATLTSTVTVLAKNYPEVKWIRPVGYTLIGVLGIEMMNSGVHWASDYPLGFLIGYSVGSVVANSKITKIKINKYSRHKIELTPQLFFTRSYGDNLVGVSFSF